MVIYIRKTVPDFYYLLSNIVITIAAKSIRNICKVNLTFNKHNSKLREAGSKLQEVR